MNILFYIMPKSEVIYVYEDFTVRQALEKMEYHKFNEVPIISRDGKYSGTLTEGDILWDMIGRGNMDMHAAEEIQIRSMQRKRDYAPVNINCEIEDLVMASMNQNFIPVIDDEQVFIGIITRKTIIQYCYDQYKALV